MLSQLKQRGQPFTNPLLCQVILITPEAFSTSDFQEYIVQHTTLRKIDLVILDEAHEALSTFRPHYNDIGRKMIRAGAKRLFLTATLPVDAEKRFKSILAIGEGAAVVRERFHMPNHSYGFIDAKDAVLHKAISRELERLQPRQKALLFFMSKDECMDAAVHHGTPAYHRDMNGKEEILKRWHAEGGALCATSALLAGVDVLNVVLVIFVRGAYSDADIFQGFGRARGTAKCLIIGDKARVTTLMPNFFRFADAACKREFVDEHFNGFGAQRCSPGDNPCDRCMARLTESGEGGHQFGSYGSDLSSLSDWSVHANLPNRPFDTPTRGGHGYGAMQYQSHQAQQRSGGGYHQPGPSFGTRASWPVPQSPVQSPSSPFSVTRDMMRVGSVPKTPGSNFGTSSASGMSPEVDQHIASTVWVDITRVQNFLQRTFMHTHGSRCVSCIISKDGCDFEHSYHDCPGGAKCAAEVRETFMKENKQGAGSGKGYFQRCCSKCLLPFFMCNTWKERTPKFFKRDETEQCDYKFVWKDALGELWGNYRDLMLQKMDELEPEMGRGVKLHQETISTGLLLGSLEPGTSGKWLRDTMRVGNNVDVSRSFVVACMALREILQYHKEQY